MGKKTVTRIPMRPRKALEMHNPYQRYLSRITKLDPATARGEASRKNFTRSFCPYSVGDLIWVRETFGVGSRSCPFNGSVDGIEYRADGKYIDEIEDLPLYPLNAPDGFYEDDKRSGWKPSIHMRKWASRLTLRITNVRVERVQEITEEQAIKEGFEWLEPCPSSSIITLTAKESFSLAWENIYGTWVQNPWVWVIEFEVIHKNILEIEV